MSLAVATCMGQEDVRDAFSCSPFYRSCMQCAGDLVFSVQESGLIYLTAAQVRPPSAATHVDDTVSFLLAGGVCRDVDLLNHDNASFSDVQIGDLPPAQFAELWKVRAELAI